MSKQTFFIESASQITIPMAFFSNNSNQLMVMLPGVGYTSDSPLFHYLRIVALNHGYDILGVKYAFQITGKAMTEQQADFPYLDTQKAIKMIWQDHYKTLCIVGKSFGTPLASRIIQEWDVDTKSLILLTPIGNAAQAVGNVRSLAVIGTKDHYYDKATITNTPSIQWHVLDGLDHSLELRGDWQRSLEKMQYVMGLCDSFLDQ